MLTDKVQRRNAQVRHTIASSEYRRLSTTHEKVLHLISNTNATQRAIGQAVGLSEATISRHATGKIGGGLGKGRPSYLHPDDSETLKAMIRTAHAGHASLTASRVSMLVSCPFLFIVDQFTRHKS